VSTILRLVFVLILTIIIAYLTKEPRLILEMIPFAGLIVFLGIAEHESKQHHQSTKNKQGVNQYEQ